MSNYTASNAIDAFKNYLGLEEAYREIPGTNGRGVIINVNNEDCVIFISPISCKRNNVQNFIDTRSSGSELRLLTWNTAIEKNLKYFHFAVNDRQVIFRDFLVSLESPESVIQDASGLNSHGTGTTQVNIPNTENPAEFGQTFKRICTPKGFYMAFVHKSAIGEYIKNYDNRPYKKDYEQTSIAELDGLIVKLPHEDKYCAQKIIDCLYDYDCMGKMLPFFSMPNNNSGDNVDVKYLKIDTDIAELGFEQGKNLLKGLFILPESEDFLYVEGKAKQRYVSDRIYKIKLGQNIYDGKLSGEWVGTPIEECSGRTNINALIKVVNYCYKNEVEIIDQGMVGNKKIRYLVFTNKRFTLPPVQKNIKDKYIRRFVSSLLAKPFVILTGNSGTGKTRIANQFSQYLEVVDDEGNKNWLLVSVGADWTDNTKVLGYYNPLADNGAGNYVPTQILELIKRANENPDVPYFLILDEMNLSHVERYFSDFLSHMEVPDNPFVIDGHNPEEVAYPKNLFVIGTVNIDETTYMFSPKVLDRANVIEYKPEKNDVLALFDQDTNSNSVNPANNGTAEAFMALADKIRYSQDNDVRAKDLFAAIYEKLAGSGFEFAFRTVAEIKKYIIASKELQGTDLNEDQLKAVIDEQLVQKILPKIHGNQKEIGILLNNLKAFCDENKYTDSSRKIEEMQAKLKNVHYASFI